MSACKKYPRLERINLFDPEVEPPEGLMDLLLEQVAQKVRDRDALTKKRLIEELRERIKTLSC